MFDPTAFDNMKVVLEGAVYDLDLAGKIIIIDRNDMINMAKMSRSFDVNFTLPEAENRVSAKLELNSDLINLAAELLSDSNTGNQAGCNLKLQFFHHGVTEKKQFLKIQELLQDIWGNTRKISQTVTMNTEGSMIHNVINIDFDRLVGEEQIDDLVEIINIMIKTIQHLQTYLETNIE